MGASLSTQKSLLLQNPSSYLQKGEVSKKLADDILRVFFENADVHDILNLSSMSQCPRYVFTTAEALQSLFQSIQIYPKLGKAGEVLFAPISEISPGLVKNKREGSQELLERTKLRNQMCMDVSYMYIRIFQIYAALALTVLNTNPTRRILQRRPLIQGFQRPRTAPLFSGGATKAGLPQSGQGLQIRKQVEKTTFAPLANYLVTITGLTGKMPKKFYLKMDDTNSPNGIYIEWDTEVATSINSSNSLTLDGIYRKKTKNTKFSITMKETASAPYREITLQIDNKDIQVFKEELATWEFVYDDESIDATEPREFYDKIHKLFADTGDKESRPSAGVSGRSSSGISIASGKSAYEGFDQLKKIYEEGYAGGKEFPKAYCIARAMTLMAPIFESERLDKTQRYYSQVCRNELDFESPGAEYMPRAGKLPSANMYLRSLISLYYDMYEIRGGEVKFTQSQAAKQELKTISKQFAGLYRITTSVDNFLESKTPFSEFPLCQAQGKKYANNIIEYTDEILRKTMVQTIIAPMLQFQQEHTNKVNELFKKMFKATLDKQGKASIGFTSALRAGGKGSINEFGNQARILLANYYAKSEALFLKGVLLLENKLR